MVHLPTEIKRIIAFHLLSDDPADGEIIHIKQLRLVNKDYALVAAEPLFSEIYLMLKPESFERMRQISVHPSYSKLVKSLRYEPDGLVKYSDYRDWVESHPSATRYLSKNEQWQAMLARLTKYTGEHGYEAGCQNYEEQYAVAIQSDEWLRSNYNPYQKNFQDQAFIRQREHNRGLFMEAMARLPGLEHVIVNFEYGIMKQMAALRKSFPVTDEWSRAAEEKIPQGVMQLRSILLSAQDADTRLKVLRCGEIHWKFFRLPEADFDRIKSALSHLTHIEIAIEGSRCHTNKNNPRLCQFLSVAKNLRILKVQSWTELKDCVGQNTWRFLTSVQIWYLDADEDSLVDFLERHAGTLQDLTLRRVKLLKGSWLSALPRVREAIKLKTFNIDALTSVNPASSGEEHWCIDCFGFTPLQIAQKEKLGTAIKAYVLNGGDFPLLDPVAYP